MLGRGLQALTGFAVIRLMTSMLSPEEAGRYYILISLTAFFALLLVSPMGMYINRKTFDWYRNRTIQKNLYLFWLYLLGVAVLAFLILLIVKATAGVGVEVTWLWLGIIVMGSLLFNTANLTITTMLNMLGKRTKFVIFTLLTLWVGVVLSFVFTSRISARAEYWLVGLTVAQLMVFLVAYRYLARSLNYSKNELGSGWSGIPKFNTMLSPISFGWPLAITAGLLWVQSQSYRFVLNRFGGLEALALFAVGYALAVAIMTICYEIFSHFYGPIFYKEISTADSEGKRIAWNKFAAYLFPAAIIMGAFTIACAPYLAKLLVDPEFIDCAQFILWGALAHFAFVLAAGFQMIAHAEMKTTLLIPAGITGAVVALVGVLALARWDPQVGTGIALTVAGFAMVLHLAIQLHKTVAFSFPWRRIFISIAFSVPLLVGLLVGINPLIGQPSYIQSIMVLAVAGIYLVVTLYLMATRWLGTVKIKRGVV